MKRAVVLWREPVRGTVRAEHGSLAEDCGMVAGERAELRFTEYRTGPGPRATLVHVEAGPAPFSFFLRDVGAEHPIFLPACGAAVTAGGDTRGFSEIEADIRRENRLSQKRAAASAPEYGYARAAAEVRSLPAPVWLGISKDMRIFEVSPRGGAAGSADQVFDEFRPRFYNVRHREEDLPELKGNPYFFRMLTGRGCGCREQIKKSLEDGFLPILNTVTLDGGVSYTGTFFVTQERSPLDAAHIRGTDMYVADTCGEGHMDNPAHRARIEAARGGEFVRDEETVLYLRIVAENSGAAPAYAFLMMPAPQFLEEKAVCFSGEDGMLGLAGADKICVLGTLDGGPIPDRELSLLLPPGERAVFEFKIPHSPLPRARADVLAKEDFGARLREAKAFWHGELGGAAKISLPERRIENMIKAGLLHIDLGYFGKNPGEPLLPIAGIYTAIGSESAPGIQFLDSMGLHGPAARALQYFVEKQHENGMIQNFAGYMLETGSALWTMGEHWRLTRDAAWADSVKDCVIRAADYLLRWRGENLDGSLRGGRGYGMIKGKVADPEDHFHSFMLNAGAFAGLRAAGEILRQASPEKSAQFAAAAAEMRGDIRESLEKSLAEAPAVPTAGGEWIRSFSTWPEYTGPLSLYAGGGLWQTHGSFVIRDALGAAYLILQGAVNAREPLGGEILDFYAEFLTLNNLAFSQPYYSPHVYGQLMRGETGQFLREFYCGFAGLADRETYTFWEHYFRGSPHKLHEETWFLMRCRWMLALEDPAENDLRLLSGVPRDWLGEGKAIRFEGLKTYYGEVGLTVESRLAEGKISVALSIANNGFPPPDRVTVRIPHPTGKKAASVTLGGYDPGRESITLDSFSGTRRFDVMF